MPTRDHKLSRSTGYLVAAGSVGLSIGTRLFLTSALGPAFPYITFFPAVMFSAWYGGLGPGLFGTALSLLSSLYFVTHLSVPGALGAILFTSVCVFICVLNESLRRARREAEQSRDLFRVTLSSIGDGVIATDATGKINFLNGVAEELTGWSLNEATGKDITEVFKIRSEITGLTARNPVERVIREGVTIALANHTELVGKDGRALAIEDSAAPIRARDGSILGVVLVFRNATERRHSEDALQRSEERLQLALRAGQIGVWDWDIVRGHVEWSEFVYPIHGVKPGEFDGRVETFTKIIHPEDHDRIQEAIASALRGESEYNVEFRLVHPDGSIHWVATTATVFRNDAGQPIRMLGSTAEITERARMTMALAASEQRLKEVFTQAAVAITTFRGPEFIFEMANPLYQALLPGRELIGRRLIDVVPEVRPESWKALQSVLDTGQPYTAEEWLVAYDRDGDGVSEDHWLNVVFNPLRDADNIVSGVIVVLTDVTAQVIARRELERANQELEEFAYVASHDLQEPLRMVNTFTQLLLKSHMISDSPAAHEYAAFIQKGVRRMEQLIRDLLAYSRALDRGELMPVAQDTSADLSLAWQEAFTMVSSRVAELGAIVSADPLPTVPGDAAQFSQVFQNLLSNALKYRREGVPPRITVTAERQGDTWLIAIRDNGIGFDQQYAKGIFGLFKRLHRDEYPGTGLGLAICQRIIQRYKGTIWAESEKGRGATFFISLPAGY